MATLALNDPNRLSSMQQRDAVSAGIDAERRKRNDYLRAIRRSRRRNTLADDLNVIRLRQEAEAMGFSPGNTHKYKDLENFATTTIQDRAATVAALDGTPYVSPIDPSGLNYLKAQQQRYLPSGEGVNFTDFDQSANPFGPGNPDTYSRKDVREAELNSRLAAGNQRAMDLARARVAERRDYQIATGQRLPELEQSREEFFSSRGQRYLEGPDEYGRTQRFIVDDAGREIGHSRYPDPVFPPTSAVPAPEPQPRTSTASTPRTPVDIPQDTAGKIALAKKLGAELRQAGQQAGVVGERPQVPTAPSRAEDIVAATTGAETSDQNRREYYTYGREPQVNRTPEISPTPAPTSPSSTPVSPSSAEASARRKPVVDLRGVATDVGKVMGAVNRGAERLLGPSLMIENIRREREGLPQLSREEFDQLNNQSPVQTAIDGLATIQGGSVEGPITPRPPIAPEIQAAIDRYDAALAPAFRPGPNTNANAGTVQEPATTPAVTATPSLLEPPTGGIPAKQVHSLPDTAKQRVALEASRSVQDALGLPNSPEFVLSNPANADAMAATVPDAQPVTDMKFPAPVPKVNFDIPDSAVEAADLDNPDAVITPPVADEDLPEITVHKKAKSSPKKRTQDYIQQKVSQMPEGDRSKTYVPLKGQDAKYWLKQGDSPAVKAMAGLLNEQESDSPKIKAMLQELGVSQSPDTYPWCAGCTSWALNRGGQKQRTVSARAFLSQGTAVDTPKFGDVAVLWNENPDTGGRHGWGGHAGLVLGESGDHVIMISGNVGDEVNVSAFPKSRVLGYRRMSKGSSGTVAQR